MSTTVALFGCTGNVGSRLVEALETKDAASSSAGNTQFLMFTRNLKDKKGGDTTSKSNVIPTLLPTTTQDKVAVCDSSALADILSSQQVKTVVLIIPQLLVHQCKEYVLDLLPAWKKAGVERVIKVGTGNAEKYAYGRKHIEGEEAIRQAGFKLTVLQGGDYSSNPQWLGPSPPGAPYLLIDLFKGMSYLSKIPKLGMFRSMGNVGNFFGTVQEPFLDLRDFAAALKVVIMDPSKKHDNKVYKIYSEAVSMQQVADVYGELLGRTLHVIDLDDDEIRGLMEMSGMEGEMLDLALEMFARFREGAYEPNDDSWSDYERLTGQKPRSFADFAKEHVQAGFKPIPIPKF